MCVLKKIYFKISMVNYLLNTQMREKKGKRCPLNLKWRLFSYEPFKFKNSLAWVCNLSRQEVRIWFKGFYDKVPIKEFLVNKRNLQCENNSFAANMTLYNWNIFLEILFCIFILTHFSVENVWESLTENFLTRDFFCEWILLRALCVRREYKEMGKG